MARLPRWVVPGIPHHIIQRGNHKETVFFSEDDKRLFLDILDFNRRKRGIEIWAYCLMENHYHIIGVPPAAHSLSKCIGETNRKYTTIINKTKEWTGTLWQGRFSSYPMDEAHTFKAVRYVEQNPVRAKLVQCAEHYKWSSAGPHVFGTPGPLLSEFYLLREIKDWRAYLEYLTPDDDVELFSKEAKANRPLGDREFINKLKKLIKQ